MPSRVLKGPPMKSMISPSPFLRLVSEIKREHCRVNYDSPFTCHKCGRRYTWTDSLTRHLREGCGMLPKYNCSSVHNSSDYYKRLGRHFCTTCGKEYKWMQSLIRHEREECGKEPQHSCPVCGAKIRHKWMLKKHLINVHKWVIPNGYRKSRYHRRYRGRYTCDVCGKEYTWKPSLTRHKREECGKQPRFECPICVAKFRRSCQLRQHLCHVHQWNNYQWDDHWNDQWKNDAYL
ncbi:zinc finger protein 606 [Harpegnathos saltator]|uniref:zinc finger protein 606 n=1 Tax=Harpegnathos saltator TaxID=610380 RepID=UPI000948CBD7|nr:zinc finger protein 606 [Harpegnathos saltator]